MLSPMLRFLLGSGLVYGAVFVASLALEPDLVDGEPRNLISVALSAFLVPMIATWLVAELVNFGSPRRLFDRRIRGTASRTARGVVGAILGAIISALALALLDTALPDALLTGLAAAASAAIVLLPLAHARRGTCIHCGYDLSGACLAGAPASDSGSAGASSKPLCPECGADVMEAMTAGRARRPGRARRRPAAPETVPQPVAAAGEAA